MSNRTRGFTLVEMIAVISLLALTAIMALPRFVRAKDVERISEARGNLHTIQIAIERYAVDNGEYPRYLLGGDFVGWLYWHQNWDGVNDIDLPDGRVASNSVVKDPLVEYGYLPSYPRNVFVDDPGKVIAQTNTDGWTREGEGDPRFGFSGNLMGQGLDDMNYFKGAIHPGPFYWSQVETRRTLDHGDWLNVPEAFKDSSTNMYYLFGGRRSFTSENNGVRVAWWPGNFFYKAAPDVVLLNRSGLNIAVPNTGSVGGVRDRYILGVYGDLNTPGIDAIRLEPNGPDGNPVSWRTPPPFDAGSFMCGYQDLTGGFGSAGGLPEVFGGGDEYTGPWMYYNEGGRNDGRFIYGAPDGVPDGIILILTDKIEGGWGE